MVRLGNVTDGATASRVFGAFGVAFANFFGGFSFQFQQTRIQDMFDQRGFSATAYPTDHTQYIEREIYRYILQVVLTGAAD